MITPSSAFSTTLHLTPSQMQTAVKLFQVMQQIEKQHYLSEIMLSIFLYEKHENMIVYIQAATFYEQIYRFHLSATNSNQPSHFGNSTDINSYHIPLYNDPKTFFFFRFT